MARRRPELLTRQDIPRDVYPYRRVWRTATIEALILLGIAVVLFVVKPQVSGAQVTTAGLVLAVTPLLLWFAVSYLAERRARLPRGGLMTVLLLSALGANAVGVPLAERVFRVDEWLSTASGGVRILGYLLTVSITQEFIKYAAVRYTIYPGALRVRLDAIAYTIAAGIGYATVLNINYVLNEPALPAVAVLRIVETTLAQVAVSTVIGFFLAELHFGDLPAVALPLGLLLAALLNALSVTVRAGLVVAGISPTSTASNPLQGLGMPVFLVVILFSAFGFLINNAEEREKLREALR